MPNQPLPPSGVINPPPSSSYSKGAMGPEPVTRGRVPQNAPAGPRPAVQDDAARRAQMRIGITTYLKPACSGTVTSAELLASCSDRLTISWSMSARPAGVVARALLLALRGYRLLLSPWLGGGCRFWPTCSLYAMKCLSYLGMCAQRPT